MITLKELGLRLSTDDKLIVRRVLHECPDCNYGHGANNGEWIYDVNVPAVIQHLSSACFARGIALQNRVRRAYLALGYRQHAEGEPCEA